MDCQATGTDNIPSSVLKVSAPAIQQSNWIDKRKESNIIPVKRMTLILRNYPFYLAYQRFLKGACTINFITTLFHTCYRIACLFFFF